MTTESGGQNTSDSQLTSITAGGTDDTKGSFTELIASTSIDCEWIQVTFLSTTADSSGLVDIAVGAAASEVVFIPNRQVWCNGSKSESFLIPVSSIASGSRISARWQADSASDTLDVAVIIHNGDTFGTSTGAIAIGADTAASTGTSVDPGGTANTKGSWTELDSSISQQCDFLVIGISIYLNNNIGAVYHTLIDIGTGSGGSETVLIGNLSYNHEQGEFGFNGVQQIIESISSGTRVVARCQSSGTDAADRDVAISITGAEWSPPAGGGGSILIHPGMTGGLNG